MSAIARHGLRTLHTFPNRIERTGMPSQKMTYTNVGAKLRSSTVVPKSAVASVTPSRKTENAPSTIRTARESTMADTRVRQRPPVRVLLENGAAPEEEEKDERDDEDDDRADEEVDRGNREVADDADPVGEQAHALTVISAIGTPRSSSSTSNRPGIVALNGSRAGCAGRDVAHDVVAVEMDVVGHVRPNDRAPRDRPSRRTRGRCRPSARRPRRRS